MSVRKQTFIQGAMILLAAGLLNRLLGFVPRVALPRMIGSEGVGLIQLVYPFMIVILTVIAGGLPLAVAKLVAEADSRGDGATVRRIVRSAMAISLTAGLTAAAACLALASWISSEVMTDPRVHGAFLAMLPVLPLVAVSSVWRGYFQGIQNMIPSALSSTAETLVRIALSLLLAALCLPYGLEAAAAGAMSGTAAGEAAGLLVLWRQAKAAARIGAPDGAGRSRSVPAEAALAGRKELYRRLLGIAVPVTGSRLIGSLSYLLESILTARSLAAAGVPAAMATAQYGELQGMVIPLLLLPGALTYSLAVSLVPSLSEAAARRDWTTIHKRLHQSMRLAVVTGAPFVVLMTLLAAPLCTLVYGHDSMAFMLRWMAPIAVFLYMQAPLQAALQALDRPGTALLNTFAGAAVKLALIVQLASQPELGIRGAVIAIGVNMTLVTLLHWISVARLTGFRLDPMDFIKIGAAVTVMSAAALWIWNRKLLPMDAVNLLSSASASALLYVLLLMLMGLIDRQDILRIPVLRRWLR
jgi:stage V sporulation protein B